MKKTCQICNNKIFKYVCPTCEIVYCSLVCYKNHNDKCVANFLENQVNDNIKNNEITEFDKKEFKFKLKKIFDENVQNDFLAECKNMNESIVSSERVKTKIECDEKLSGDDEDESESNYLKKWCISKKRYKILTKLAINDNLKLEDLNKTEKKQFFSFLKNNDMNQYIDKYEPWWLNCVIKKMDTPDHICCKTNVNGNVIFIIIEIIYSYCYLLRIYNESITNKEFCYLLLFLANSLNRFYLPESNILNTINSLFQRILENDDLAREKNVLYNVITDVMKILNLKELILRCLYETKKSFKKEVEKINKKNNQITDNFKNKKKEIEASQEQKLFKYVNKKIKFLYSYSNYHYENFSNIQFQLSNFYKEQKHVIESNNKREVVLDA